MGVKDLWQLLSPIGRRISIETLDGKALAIDMSIWLTQFIKAMRDEEGKMIKNAHLIGTIRRILKLLFHRIRPVFVFDGATPQLKVNVVQRRRKVHERHESTRRAAIRRLILNQLKQQLKETTSSTTSNNNNNTNKKAENGQYAANFNAPTTSLGITAPSDVAPNSTSSEVTVDKKEDISGVGNPLSKQENNPNELSQISTTKKLSKQTGNEFHLIDENDDDIAWEGGYETLKGKTLDDDGMGSNSEDEIQYNLPETYQDLNVEVLASLPVPMRKQIVEELRRKERIKSRSNYIPVADNPLLYSQTQLANFLKTSKLNRKVEAAQKFIDGEVQGRRIASEGNKKYLFVTKEEQEGFETNLFSSSGRRSYEEKKKQAQDEDSDSSDDSDDDDSEIDERRHFSDYEEDDQFETIIGPGFYSDDVSPKKKRKRIRSYKLRAKDASPGKKSKFRRLQKAIDKTSSARTPDAINTTSTALSGGVPLSPKLLKSKEIPQHLPTITAANVDTDDNSEYGGGGGFLAEDSDGNVLNLNTEREKEKLFDGKNHSNNKENNFYDDLHNDDDEHEENLDDVEWEAESEGCDIHEEKSVESSGEINFGSNQQWEETIPEAFEENSEMPDAKSLFQRSNAISLERTRDIPQPKQLDVIHPTSSFSGSLLESHTTTASTVSGSTLDRAIATASNMADWAGRVVRKALKEHLHKDSSTFQPSQIEGTSFTREGSTYPISTLTSFQSNSSSIMSKNLNSLPLHSHTTNWNQVSAKINQSEESQQEVIDLAYQDDESQKIQKNDSIVTEFRASPFVTNDPYEINREESSLPFRMEDLDELSEGEENESLKKILVSTARDTERLTEDMKAEVMELIKAFDLPYIIAPFEAEAQCAVLEQLGLVDGVITEDSDAFLFGARAVYKNIFNDKKYVEVYLVDDAERELGVKREDMIALAYFLGSDYTEGVNGIGIVNAMEIIQAFPFGQTEEEILGGLQKFREWLQGYDPVKELVENLEEKNQKRLQKQHTASSSSSRQRKRKKANEAGEVDAGEDGTDVEENEENANEAKMVNDQEMVEVSEDDIKERRKNEALILFDKKHKTGRSKWNIPENFPDPRVCEAYLQPMTNRDNEKFLWRYPNISKIRNYCQSILGWTDGEMDAQVNPVIKKFMEKNIQTRIDQHFLTYQDDTRFARIASDRLKAAVIQITGKSTDISLLGPKKRSVAKRKKHEDNSQVTEKDHPVMNHDTSGEVEGSHDLIHITGTTATKKRGSKGSNKRKSN